MSAATLSAAGARRKRDWPKHLCILALLGIELLPFYMMMQISMKDNHAFFGNPWLPANPFHWVWENWVYAGRLILPYVANSIVVSVSATVGCLVVALLAAYFFARYRMPGSNILWSLFLVLMLLPSVANIVPLFAVLKGLNLLNTLWALIILGVAGGQVFCIYLLRNFIEDIPKDLFEAAEMDGATHFQQLQTVVIPMSGPILGTLAILQFLSSWNDYLMPLIVLRDPEIFTIGVGLIYLDGEYVKQWGRIMASFFLASIPLIIIFLFTMKLFVRGLSAGAVKG
ncbi:MAG TPA: carbohydrate ABC transporter permease [Chthoniobacterales bacterium]